MEELLKDEDIETRIRLLYCVRTDEDILFRELLAHWARYWNVKIVICGANVQVGHTQIPLITVCCFWVEILLFLADMYYKGTVGGGAGCRVLLIPGSWFGFPTQANHTFHRFGELVPDLSGKDKALSCSSAGHRK
ncbi:unnamed protein product [Heligmosomoides polygyrus]|uniref:TIR domain-containing protein n=1 Tax=Heligmosomoides polygyrus TaxID=6339 RepID=A0A183FUP9_HELPZ|nr:unnamed protein product [Heligmosomoides polygyrus]